MNSNQFQNQLKDELNEEIDNLIIKDYKSQIESLKSYISNLEIEIKKLKTKIRELGKRNTVLIEYEYENISLNTEKKELKETIENLEQDVLSAIKKGKDETRDVTFKLENEVNNYKRINDTVKGKIEAAEYIIKLNSIQHNRILNLEKELDDMKKNNLKNIDKLTVEHELHYKRLKKRMLDLIRQSNQEIEKENKINIEIRSKFRAIDKDEMLEELEKQNLQIMQLIKENEAKKKQIYNLSQEKKTLFSVDKIMRKKNLKFSKLIEAFLEKHNNKDENNNNKNSNENENLKLFKTTMINKNPPQSPKLEKAYNNLLNNYNLLKEKLDYIIDKDKSFQRKYCGIILLYDTALKNLLKDEKIISKKLNINLNEFKEGDIDKYSKEEKIKIICLLIKHLLPLIKIQSNEIIKLRNLFNNIHINFKINSSSGLYSRNQNSNIIKSLVDIKQFSSDLNYSLKKEKNLKLKKNSIFNTYNNTYNNNHKNIFNLINTKEESKSIRASFFGLNIDTSAIKKKSDLKLDKNTNNNTNSNIQNYNKFAFSAFNFYKNNNKSKNNGIKLYKRGKLKDELINQNSPLQRLMIFNDINKEQKSKNKCVTENNFSS